ncbi:MAG TPA: bifunctional diguanylate cyclase/phosphodiesterase [Steroidobacteraceae bacterium]|nr:bifunctional diguanylate cyclase/phosphodiesterase [Steroidobacteraceae bacterium]
MTVADSTIDTVTESVLPTSLDPYGQLIKMLMPRALGISLFDRDGMVMWISDGTDSPDLQELINEAVAASTKLSSEQTHAGFAREWNGDTAYVFVIRNGRHEAIGYVGVISPDTSQGARPFTTLQGLLRPALDVLARELTNQYNIDDLQRHLSARDGDLELLLDTSADTEGDDFDRLVRACTKHLGCALGALLIPDKNISICATGEGMKPGAGAEVLARTHRHLLAWSQVQRRTLALNKVAASGPLGTVPYKILACPVLLGAQRVVGILLLFKTASGDDFDLRQIRIGELLARRVAHVLDNTFDSATGLFTRPALEHRVAAMMAASSANAMQSVIYMDIDRLHVLNENYGMHVGDEVIARIAEVLSSNLTPRMVATRISGDRFALFLADTGLEAAQQVGWSLCRAIHKLLPKVDDKVVDVSASFGVARVVAQSKNPLSHALAAAEVACKAAKDRGRGRVEVYQDADVSIIRRHEDVMVLGAVRDALANDRFRLDAQPIVEFGKDMTKHRRFELLLRMIDPSGESIAPDKFLSAAERYQLAPAIDRWVLNFVLEVLSSAAPKLQQLGAHFAVNLSGQSLGDEGFPEFLEAKLREYSLPPELISFELTETAAVTNIVRAEALMRRLREMGHEFALDDFGRGLSSLTYLQSLPASYLKIDGALVRDVVGNPRSQAMITAIIQLANAMKLKTTAECVESEAISRAVAQLGVHYGQGFHIGRPRPLENVLKDLMLEASGGATTSVIMRGISRLAG